jgi:hypothetical protein
MDARHIRPVPFGLVMVSRDTNVTGQIRRASILGRHDKGCISRFYCFRTISENSNYIINVKMRFFSRDLCD